MRGDWTRNEEVKKKKKKKRQDSVVQKDVQVIQYGLQRKKCF